VSELSAFEIEMAIDEVKRHKSPGINLIPEEIIQAGNLSTRSEIHNLINSVWNEEEFPEEWKESIIVRPYLYEGR
jgi:hypothetical protein